MQTLFSVAMLVMFVAIGMIADRSAVPSNVEDRFYQSAGQGDLETVCQMFHPALPEKVGRPVMGAWVEAVEARLGPLLVDGTG